MFPPEPKTVAFEETILTVADPNWVYEKALAKAEHLVGNIKSGKLSLAELFEHFSLASRYLQECESFLARKAQEMGISLGSSDSEMEE